jgi:hypothetical protein
LSNELTKVEPQAGQIARQSFGSQELQFTGETAAMAVAAQAKAAIEARYILALRQKRSWNMVRSNLLHECERPSFAAVARYRKPIGKGVEGPSIRFAEAALRCMTNVFPETLIVYESQEKRIVQVTVTDLECNVTYSSQIVIDKTVERKKLADGQQPISERKNSYGDVVYLVPATEDDLLNKQNALISKALRTNALRLLPGDILDECMTQVKKTQAAEVKKDPDAEKKNILDNFDEIGVRPIDIEAYIGHSLDRIVPAELVELRKVFVAIRDGDATWDKVMESRESTGSTELQDKVLREKLAGIKPGSVPQFGGKK